MLDIHVGQLISPRTQKSYDYYYLNYCKSTGAHRYTGSDSADTPDYISGITSYDTTLHESFF